MAPRRGLEPPTCRLTAECSTIELSRNVYYMYYYINNYYKCNTFFKKFLSFLIFYDLIYNNIIFEYFFNNKNPYPKGYGLNLIYYRGFIVGNSNTSLIDAESVKNIINLSTPNPRPPVGGIPISRAFINSSSII
jgi:hypothetical protein